MRDERFDLVLTGLQSDDQGFAQTGVVLAERLGLPHATIVMEVLAATGRCASSANSRRMVSVGRDADAGPADDPERIRQLRYATLKGIMAAKKKEIRTVAASRPAGAHQQIASLYVREKSKRTTRGRRAG